MRWFTAVVAVAMLGGVACANGSDETITSDASAPRASAEAPATGAPKAKTASSNDATGAVTSSAPPDASTPPQRPGTAERPQADGGSTPAEPAAAGRYEFETDGTTRVADGPPRDLPKVTTLTVDAPRKTDQRSLRDLRDKDGTGGATEQILRFAEDGVHLVFFELHVNLAGVSRTYSFRPQPPPLVVKTDAQPGDATRFTLRGDGVTIVTSVRVTDVVDTTIGDDRIETLVVRFDSKLTGELEGEQRAINRIATSRSLTVHEDVANDVTFQSVRVRTDYVARARSLSPS